jgi:hypothetical protein
MDDPGPLQDPDITAHLRHAASFGITTGQSVDGIATIELTTDLAVQGARGAVRVERAAPGEPRLFADVRRGGELRATCASRDSIRVWGRFAPEVELVIRSAEPVRLVARTPAGAVLAGPLLVQPDGPPTSLGW